MNRSEVKNFILTNAYSRETSTPVQDIEHFRPSESYPCPFPISPLLPEAINGLFCFSTID